MTKLLSTTPLVLSRITMNSNQFQFQIRGRANDVYQIEALTNLIHWATVATNQASSDGTANFSDS